MKPKNVIIDTDLGDDVDDAVAIVLAVLSPEIEVAGLGFQSGADNSLCFNTHRTVCFFL